MKVFLIILAILFLRMLLARGKKSVQKQNDLAKKIADQARRNHQTEIADTVRLIKAPQLSSRTTTDDVEMNSAYVIDNDQGYAAAEVVQTESANQLASEDILTTSEHEAVSHFKSNVGFTDKERRDQNTEEAAYQLNVNTSKKGGRLISLTPDSYRKFIVAKEIFDKPRSMRR